MSLYTLKQSSHVEGKTIEKVIINGVTKGICEGIMKCIPRISCTTLFITIKE